MRISFARRGTCNASLVIARRKPNFFFEVPEDFNSGGTDKCEKKKITDCPERTSVISASRRELKMTSGKQRGFKKD